MDATEQGFRKTLANRPEDHTTRLVYADWLAERGRDREEKALRWMVRNDKFPALRRPDMPGKRIIKPYGWFSTGAYADAKQSRHVILPRLVFLALEGAVFYAIDRLYYLPDQAEAALVAALVKMWKLLED